MPLPALPSIEDRLVEPESDKEMIDGRVIRAMPADPEHGDRQCKVAYVLSANTAPEFTASTELLTRTDHGSDFATDACIRRRGIDPATQERYLEELSFEVKHTQSLKSLTKRAQKLIARGVRRVFIIYVARGKHKGEVRAGPVKEWRDGAWVTLDADGEIVDRCFHTPIQVRALINDIAAHNAVARALIKSKNPVLMELEAASYQKGESDGYQKGESDGYHKGKVEALREAIVDLCEALDIAVDPLRRARVDSMNAAELGELRSALKANRRWPRDAADRVPSGCVLPP